MNIQTLAMPVLVGAVLAGAALLYVNATARDVASPALHPEELGDCVPVDLDFTRMNATMQATYLYRLTATPSEFAGKSMRLAGAFLTGIDAADGQRHYGCLVGNAAGCACCSPALILEFIPKDAYVWPTDFPPKESPVTIVGTLEMFEVGDNRLNPPITQVPKLTNADLAWRK